MGSMMQPLGQHLRSRLISGRLNSKHLSSLPKTIMVPFAFGQAWASSQKVNPQLQLFASSGAARVPFLPTTSAPIRITSSSRCCDFFSECLRHCGHRPVSASAKHRSSTVQVTCHLEYIFFILLHVNLR